MKEFRDNQHERIKESEYPCPDHDFVTRTFIKNMSTMSTQNIQDHQVVQDLQINHNPIMVMHMRPSLTQTPESCLNEDDENVIVFIHSSKHDRSKWDNNNSENEQGEDEKASSEKKSVEEGVEKENSGEDEKKSVEEGVEKNNSGEDETKSVEEGDEKKNGGNNEKESVEEADKKQSDGEDDESSDEGDSDEEDKKEISSQQGDLIETTPEKNENDESNNESVSGSFLNMCITIRE